MEAGTPLLHELSAAQQAVSIWLIACQQGSTWFTCVELDPKLACFMGRVAGVLCVGPFFRAAMPLKQLATGMLPASHAIYKRASKINKQHTVWSCSSFSPERQSSNAPCAAACQPHHRPAHTPAQTVCMGVPPHLFPFLSVIACVYKCTHADCLQAGGGHAEEHASRSQPMGGGGAAQHPVGL